MEITAQAQMLFRRVEFRRFVLIIGTLVATVVVSQCFAFRYGKTLYFLSVSSKDSTAVIFANAGSSSNYSKSTEEVLEDEVGYENEVMDDEDTDYELASEFERNSTEKFVFEKGNVDLDVRFQMESDMVRGNVSTQEDTDHTASLRTTSSVDSEKNVEESKEIQHKDGKIELMRSDSEDSVTASMLMPRRWDKKPTTISQMNSLLLRSPISARLTVWI